MIVIASRSSFESNFTPLIAFLFRSTTSHRCLSSTSFRLQPWPKSTLIWALAQHYMPFQSQVHAHTCVHICPIIPIIWSFPIVVVLQSLSHVQLVATPWTVTHQTPLSMGFSRQEYYSGLPFSSPGELPDQGIEPTSPELADRFFIVSVTREAPFTMTAV